MGFSTYAEIYSNEITGVMSGIGTTLVPLTVFEEEGRHRGCEVDISEDRIIVGKPGAYDTTFAISFSGSAGTTWYFDFSINGVRQYRGISARTATTAGVISATISAILNLSRGDYVAMLVKANEADKTLTVFNISLTIIA